MLAGSVLKKYFGYTSFRPGQKEMIAAILKGRDCLAIMPTGAGKSICYQVPALMMDGITLVISPLISLMMDQVKSLKEAGIPAAYINSALNEAQIRKALTNAENGMYKIIYAAPERLCTERFRRFAEHAKISMITVDEAHCISQWGQDFRPSYLRIAEFMDGLSYRPIVSAFTATATEEVKEDIEAILKLQKPKVVVTGFDRENLYYTVEHPRRKDAFVLDYIRKHRHETGIVYCATRKNCDQLKEVLCEHGIQAGVYHAGMDQEERRKSQEDFIYDRISVMIATNAFGMGIDKSNVRYVLHYNMPHCMENYYQEAGRAGRDGEKAECILLYSPQDLIIARFLLDHKDFSAVSEEDAELIRQRDRVRLSAMEHYATTSDCLRCTILRYFGEEAKERCGNCGSCNAHFRSEDITEEARWIVRCVREYGGRYGASVITGTLVGADRGRLREIGAENSRCYGQLKGMREADLKEIIDRLVEMNYLSRTEDLYRVLRPGPLAMQLKDPDCKIQASFREEHKVQAAVSGDSELLRRLKQLRLTMSKQLKVPPYVIFTDRTLNDLCAKMPKNKEEMLEVSGVAERKYNRYGRKFLNEIKAYRKEFGE